jgi:glycosyltransferase involved in cell wall biosynthesis
VPRVSFVIPVRAPRLDWLEETLRSVLAQTLADFEALVVVDDAQPLDAFLARIGDARIRQLHLPHMPGLPAALNAGVEAARAPLIARLDADDIAEPSRIERQVALFDADDALDVAGAQLRIIDDDGRVTGHRDYPTDHDSIAAALRRYNALAHPAVMFRRDRVLAAGGYPPVPMEDYDLWCRMAVAGARFANHPEQLVRYRYRLGTMARRNIRETLRQTIAIKRRHFGRALGISGEVRVALERLLMFLPQNAVDRLFRVTQLNSRR